MKQYLKLKLSQKLSPQQIQLMKLIQLPTLDFEQKIHGKGLPKGNDPLVNFDSEVAKKQDLI